MACNCKNKYNALRKYADDPQFSDTDISGNISLKIVRIILQFFFGILCGAVIIVMIVPALMYIILCLMTGKSPHFTLKRIKHGNNK